MDAQHCSVGLALLVGAALACGDDDGTGPAASEITGTWQATTVEYVKVGQPAQTKQMLEGGGTATLVLAAAGTYIFTITPAGQPADIETGAWQLQGDIMVVTPAGSLFSLEFDVSLSGNTLRLTGADSEYDFDDDGNSEPAKLNLVLIRSDVIPLAERVGHAAAAKI